MLTDHDNINDLVFAGVSEIVGLTVSVPASVSIDPQAITQFGLKVTRGRALVRNRCILPVIENRTCTAFFFEYNRAKLGDVSAEPGPSRAKVSDALMVTGHPWYYHFLANHLPALTLLSRTTGEVATWATALGYPPALEEFVQSFLAHLASGRSGQIVTMADGVYDVENVIFAFRPNYSLAPIVGAHIVVPMILAKAGIADPLRELGPIKLFVRREGANMGRALLNQSEVEAWFVARGYTSVNPGALSFAEQVILFSRATHIAGAEGGAFANLIFAINVRQVIMFGAPATYQDRFFQAMVSDRGVPFHALYGHYVGTPPFPRSADFTLPMQELAALDPSVTS